MTATETSHDAWLKERKSYIGGSDSYGAVAMLDEEGKAYFGKTPLSVYLDKVTDDVQERTGANLEWGLRHERTMAEAYTDRTGRTTQAVNETRRDREHPFLGASLDRLVRSGPRERRILELKTSERASWWGQEHDGIAAIPPPYYCQVQHYLMVTRADVADLAVLIGSSDFRIYEIPPDQDFIADMREREVKLWKDHIEKRTPPDPMPWEAAMRWQQSEETVLTCSPFHDAIVRDYLERRARMKEDEARAKAQEAQIQMWMGPHRYLAGADGKPLIDWFTVTPKGPGKIDDAAIEKADPELYAELIRRYAKKAKPYRRFTLKNGK